MNTGCKSWTRTKWDGKCYMKGIAVPVMEICSGCDSGIYLDKGWCVIVALRLIGSPKQAIDLQPIPTERIFAGNQHCRQANRMPFYYQWQLLFGAICTVWDVIWEIDVLCCDVVTAKEIASLNPIVTKPWSVHCAAHHWLNSPRSCHGCWWWAMFASWLHPNTYVFWSTRIVLDLISRLNSTNILRTNGLSTTVPESDVSGVLDSIAWQCLERYWNSMVAKKNREIVPKWRWIIY